MAVISLLRFAQVNIKQCHCLKVKKKRMFEVLGVRRCEIVFIVFEFVLLGRKKLNRKM